MSDRDRPGWFQRAGARRCAAVVCVVVFVGWSIAGATRIASSPAPLSPALVAAVADMKLYLSEATGRKFTQEVPLEMMSAEQVRAYLTTRLREDYPGSAIADEQATMVHFGFLAPGDDLEALFIGMLSEQAAGFYEPDEQRLFLVQGKPFAGIALVHELAHALQDQSFSVKGMMDRARSNDDRMLAFQALIEGEAMALSARYAAARPEMAGSLAGLESADSAADDLAAAMAGLERLPAILRESMMFPYTTGMSWAGAIGQRGGAAAMDRQFRTPPASSEQILHPEKAEAPRDDPSDIAASLIPDLSSSGYRTVKANTMGEFAIRLLFSEAGASGAAAGWDADRYAVYRGRTGSTSMLWLSAWDSREDADQFQDMVTAWLQRRHAAVKEGDSGYLLGRSPADRRVVWVAEGFEPRLREEIGRRLSRDLPGGVALK